MGMVTTLQLVSLAVLARLLSPSDFGLMGMVMVVIGFGQAFADMGISNAIIHRPNVTRDQLSSLYWLNIIAGVIVFFIVCASTPLVIGFYREPRLPNLLFLTAVIFLITPLGQQFQIILQKKLIFDVLAKIEITTAVVNSTVAIGFAYAGFGVYSIIFGQLVAASVKVALLFAAVWQKWRPSLHFAERDIRSYMSFGLYQMGERSINYLNSNLDYLLIGAMLGASALGYYTLAYNLIIKPSNMINSVITKVAFPVFSLIQNETEKIRRGYFKVIQLLAAVNFPMMFGLAVVAPLAVPVIFGEQWMSSIILIQILAIVGLFRSTGNPVGSLLLAKGRADLGFKWNLGLTATQIPGLYLGVKLCGTIGAAIAFSILMALSSILNYRILIHILLGPCLRKYIQSMWPSLRSSGIMACIVITAGIFLKTLPQQINLIIQILIGLLVYISLMLYSEKMMALEMINIFWKKND